MPRLSHSGRIPTVASWIALALLGLVVAAGISLAASKLSRQHIGLSSEPLSAGRQLVPAEAENQRKSAVRHAASHPKPRQQSAPPVQSAPPLQSAPQVPQPVQPVQPAQPKRSADDSGKDDSGGRTGSSGNPQGGDD